MANLARLISLLFLSVLFLASDHVAAQSSSGDNATALPLPPSPEPITVVELPLPPVVSSNAPGACSWDINPHGTGCIGKVTGLGSGNFLPDNKHAVASIVFTGAPLAPDPRSIYSGLQLIVVKTDKTIFSNGDPWKCVTCGIAPANQVGRVELMDYPQAFSDGKRVLAGPQIIDCGDYQLTDVRCNPLVARIYPIRWNISPTGAGAGGSIRELRLHPDQAHLGWSSLTYGEGGSISQTAYIGRLSLNEVPSTGTPLSARYDLLNVTALVDRHGIPQITANAGELSVNNSAIGVGELRGFSGSGEEVTYIGAPTESCNIDVYAINLLTGKIRRLTAHPEYVDPVDISADDKWTAVMDTRGTGRQMWLSGMRGIPPIVDLIVTAATSSTRNNGERRFFRPFLIDRYGDRGRYYGQQINGAGDGSPGSINDPQWNGRADPKFSPDGTKLVYYEALTVSPACGGTNPLPCPVSTAQGGREERMMMATFPSRTPYTRPAPVPFADVVPWGIPYVPGIPLPANPHNLAGGSYTLRGAISGTAKVTIVEVANTTSIQTVAVNYCNFSDSAGYILNGPENVTVTTPFSGQVEAQWYSDITQTGEVYGTKKTTPDGFHLSVNIFKNIFVATGNLTTTLDSVVWYQPANGT